MPQCSEVQAVGETLLTSAARAGRASTTDFAEEDIYNSYYVPKMCAKLYGFGTIGPRADGQKTVGLLTERGRERGPLPEQTGHHMRHFEPRRVELSRREREVLDLVSQGFPDKDIAGRLGISRRTVKHHVGNLLQELDCDNRTQLCAWALRRPSAIDGGRVEIDDRPLAA